MPTVTQEELFQQVLIDGFSGTETTEELVALCDEAGMFEDDPGLERAAFHYKARKIRSFARQGGWVDKDGNELPIYNVVRVDRDTKKKVHLYIDLRLATFEDQVYLVKDRLSKAAYYRDEARQLYRDGCRKFGRKFQKLFQFA